MNQRLAIAMCRDTAEDGLGLPPRSDHPKFGGSLMAVPSDMKETPGFGVLSSVDGSVEHAAPLAIGDDQ